jgi:hypothetical protein
MLFHEKGPKVERNFAASSRAAGDDRSTSSKAIEAFDKNIAADVFDDEINASTIRDFADVSWPMGICRVEDEFSAEMLCENAFGFGRTGADNARAELFCNLNRGRTDTACATDDEHPIALADRGAVGEHVHGGAASESESGGGIEIEALRKPDEAAGGDEDFFGETTIAVNAEELTEEAF